jgi:hypothetical protein
MCPSPGHAQSPRPLSEEILAGWKETRLAEGATGVREARFRLVSTRNGVVDPEMSRDVTYVITANGRSRKLATNTSVICINEQYTFFLSRNEPSQPWLLDNVFMEKSGPQDAGLIQLLLTSDFHQVLYPATQVWPSVSHYDALVNGRLALTDAGPVPNGMRKTSFRLTYGHPAADSITYESLQAKLQNHKVAPAELAKMWENLQRKQQITGTMLLDPAHSWRPVQVELKSQEGVSVTKFHYGEAGGFPCRELTREDDSKTTHSSLKIVYTQVSDNADPAEFYLTYYDLPEPVGVTAPTPAKWRRLIVFVGAALAFGLLAVLFRHLARRPTRVRASP